VDDRDLIALSDRFLDGNGMMLGEEALEGLTHKSANPDQVHLQFAGRRIAVEQVLSAEAPRIFGFQAHPNSGD
jgi:hypothetical protein